MRIASPRLLPLLLAAACLGVAFRNAAAAGVYDWFAPWVVLEEGDRRELAEGEVLVETLRAEGPHMAVFLAGKIDVGAAEFVRKVRDSRQLWRSERVPHVVHFSSPPRLSDLAALELSDKDLSALRDCRPGACDVKLTDAEIQRVRQTMARAGDRGRGAVQRVFREMMLARVVQYQAHGLAGLGQFHDHDEPVDAAAVGAALLKLSPWIAARAPDLARFLATYPAGSLPGSESRFYWLETTHPPKPTVQAVHVVIYRPRGSDEREAEAVVISRQIFSTHYINGSLAVSVLMRAQDVSSPAVLAYVNRSHVDGLDGWLSGLRRFFVERQVRGRAAEIFALQRERLEE